MKTKGGKLDRFRVTTGVRQGCCLSPVLFNIYIDKIISEVLSLGSIGGHHLQNVDEFCYLGSVVQKSRRCCEEIKNRIVKASTAFNCWRKRVFPMKISLEPSN